MSERRRRFWALGLYMVLAQVAINVPVWSVTGHTVSSHVYLAMIGIVSIVGFALAARASDAGKEESKYLQFLVWEFLYTVAEAVIIIIVSPVGGPAGSHQFRWTGLIVGLIAAAALCITAAIYDLAGRSYFLDILSRRVFRQPLSPGFGLVDREIVERDIRNAIPPTYPRPGSPRDEQGPRGGQREPRSTGLTEDLARGTAWAEGLLAESSRSEPPRGVPTPVMTSAGFVRLQREGIKLAVINYFRPGHLFRALRRMPRSILFAGESFPVVARPWLPVQHRGGIARDGHCWVTIGKDGERYGVVTAEHVIVPQNSAIGSEVGTRTLRTATAGTLRKKSLTMDAALIELRNEPRPRLVAAPHSKVPGLKPIRLCTGHGHVDGLVIELSGFIWGTYPKNPGGEPDAPALMILDVTGVPGDSGSLVLDIDPERRDGEAPYLMYRGAIQLGGDYQAGRGIFLDQIAYHWQQVNFQFKLKPGSDSITPIPMEDA